ncbi:hypothetical protein HW555_011012 [Spodoptera exigua]|uniref:HAT C-terminal dimerisation domain-containing protein n=1 Tax=Spodoptera exigua TaxID=7107 RepID=A0A835L530_SPOEX|nr:hypothetical protein HW555_011012 [Spodoptera exigua]
MTFDFTLTINITSRIKTMSQKRPGSPSILSGYIKLRCKEDTIKKEVATQTVNEPYVARNKNNILFEPGALSRVDFYNQRPSDERNENFSRLIAFEMERVPEDRRTNLYAQIINLIRIYRAATSEAAVTTDLISKMDMLFDSVNSDSSDLRRGKKHATNLKEPTPHLHCTRTPPSKERWVWTLNAIELLWNYLRNKHAIIKSLATRRLQQDPLENLFGCIRGNCGANYNPTAGQFIAALKTSILSNLAHLNTGNCESDYCESIIDNYKEVLTKSTNICTDDEKVENICHAEPSNGKAQACAYRCNDTDTDTDIWADISASPIQHGRYQLVRKARETNEACDVAAFSIASSSSLGPAKANTPSPAPAPVLAKLWLRSVGFTTSNMWTHVKRYHEKELKNDTPSTSTTEVGPPLKKQATLEHVLNKNVMYDTDDPRAKAITQTIAEQICIDMEPFDIIGVSTNRYELINSLRRVLERIKNATAMDDNAYSPEYNAFILNLIAGINDRFDYLETDETFILATALDPRYKLRTFTLQSTSVNARRMLISLLIFNSNNTYRESPHSTEAPRQNQNDIFSGIWSACDSLIKEAENDEPLSNMSIQPEQEEVESYLRFPNIPIKQDPKIYWRQEDKYPKLKKLAQKYLSYPMSSVASERLFSTAGLIQNDLRNRLSADNLNKLCFLNKNLQKDLEEEMLERRLEELFGSTEENEKVALEHDATEQTNENLLEVLEPSSLVNNSPYRSELNVAEFAVPVEDTPMACAEIKVYLGVLILIGLNPLPDMELYRSSDTFNPEI